MHAGSQQVLTYGCLSNKLELLMRPHARQHLLQLGCSEEELKVDLCVSVVLLVFLHRSVDTYQQPMQIF